MPRDPAATLLDIREAIISATGFVEQMNRATFLADRRTQKAVIYDIQTIGEAIKRLPRQYCLDHPEVPWSAAAGMRDKLVHDYDQVNLDRVWFTVTESLPALLRQIEPLLPHPTQ